MRKGRALEKLVKLIETSLGTGENVKIESPKFLLDKSNEEQREFDVVISIKMAQE